MKTKIYHYEANQKDLKAIKNKNKPSSKKLFFDYSSLVVRKPWGYEYLLFQSKKIAIWILNLNKGHQTSMHAHLHMKTSLIVLDGKITSVSMNGIKNLKTGDCVIIEQNSFHQSINNSSESCILMEIIYPNYKNDLLRLKDKYGRQNQGYEKQDKFSVNVNNYNYITLESQNVHFNKTKRFGKSSVKFHEINNSKTISKFQNSKSSLFTLLDGKLSKNNKTISIGDCFDLSKKEDDFLFNKKSLLLETKINDEEISVSDAILNILNNKNINEIFLVPGDTNLHLMDAIGRNENINYFSFQKEDSAAFAALASSKLTNKISVLCISAGSSAARIIEALTSAFIDSEPLLVISGQAISSYKNNKLRQTGNKSINIKKIVGSITKYMAVIENENSIGYHINKALYLSKIGRPGPCWIDIPINFLGKKINLNKLKFFNPPEIKFDQKFLKLSSSVEKVYKFINQSKRPIIIVGYGIKLSGAESNLIKLIKLLNIPVLTSRRGSDLIKFNNKLYFGRPGVYGNRYSNFILQNCDLLISIGSRLSIPLTGRDTSSFARNAKKIIIDVDLEEINKHSFKVDLLINESADDFINSMILNNKKIKKFHLWIKKCSILKKNFNFSKELYKHNDFINPYIFIKKISKYTKDDSVIIMDGGVVMNFVMQALEIRKKQRLISASGLDGEGFSLPASIGISLIDKSREIICFCEEKSFLNSLNELNTIHRYGCHIKIICFSNISYTAIKGTQKDFFGNRFVATDELHGKKFYDLKKLVNNFNVEFMKIDKKANINNQIKKFFNIKKSILCNVVVDTGQEISPKMGFSLNDSGKWVAKPLEDMYPYLPTQMIKKNTL